MNAHVSVSASPRPAIIRSSDFDKMLRAGALDRFSRVELRDGVIYEMNPQYSDHGYLKGDLAYALRQSLTDLGLPLKVGTEISLRGDDMNMPAPDVSVCAPFPPGPIPLDAVRLLIEVADTTLDYDLGPKLALYARFGIPEYWVVDVKAGILRQFASPDGETYGETRRQALDEPIFALTVDGLGIKTGWRS